MMLMIVSLTRCMSVGVMVEAMLIIMSLTGNMGMVGMM